MVLTETALKAINIPRTRSLLSIALDVSEQAISKYIKANSDNLTKAAALDVIKKETGMVESEILTGETITA